MSLEHKMCLGTVTDMNETADNSDAVTDLATRKFS